MENVGEVGVGGMEPSRVNEGVKKMSSSPWYEGVVGGEGWARRCRRVGVLGGGGDIAKFDGGVEQRLSSRDVAGAGVVERCRG